VKSYDTVRVAEFNEAIGDRPLTEATLAWRTWLDGRRGKPATTARWRAVLQAALNHGCAAHEVPAVKLPAVKGANGEVRAIYLPDAPRRRLLAAYNPHAACPVLLLAYQGMRTQEALQLDWRRVDFDRRTINLPAWETKSARGRTIAMHPRVDALLFGLWSAVGKPEFGRVFRGAKGIPYADTRGRDGRQQGGNPLTTAHATACKFARITGFRVHDWRHDWATRMVWAGTDLPTLMQLGGWTSLRSVQRYATTSDDRMAQAIRRLA
jgi:integrase